jgi:hypothetical protein
MQYAVRLLSQPFPFEKVEFVSGEGKPPFELFLSTAQGLFCLQQLLRL